MADLVMDRCSVCGLFAFGPRGSDPALRCCRKPLNTEFNIKIEPGIEDADLKSELNVEEPRIIEPAVPPLVPSSVRIKDEDVEITEPVVFRRVPVARKTKDGKAHDNGNDNQMKNRMESSMRHSLTPRTVIERFSYNLLFQFSFRFNESRT